MDKMKNSVREAVDEVELDEAERLADENEGQHVYTHKLRKPFCYEGRQFEEITFDWGKLTGRDGLAIENEMQALNMSLIVPAFSGEYLIRMAARASVEKVPADVLTALPLQDYNRIRSAGRSFLLKTES